MPSKIELALAFLQNKPTPLWRNGDRLSYEEMQQLAAFSATKVQPLFAVAGELPVMRFTVETLCIQCQKTFESELSKSALMRLLGPKCEKKYHDRVRLSEWKCHRCRSEENRKQKAETKKSEEDFSERKERMTDELCDPERKFDGPAREWWRKLSAYFIGIDQNELARRLRALPYQAFLETPYWQAVSQHVRYRAQFKCQLCGSTGRLNVHHRDYGSHGYEASNLGDLICLCETCHGTFHNKLPAGASL